MPANLYMRFVAEFFSLRDPGDKGLSLIVISFDSN